jgi:CBS domain containing-hemolysin-like protein
MCPQCVPRGGRDVTTAWALLGLAVALIAANAVFVAAETALVTVDRQTVDRAATAGQRRMGMVAGALSRLSTYLSGAQLGITVTSLAVGLVTEPSAARLLHGPIVSFGLSEDAAETVAVAVALLAATVVQMIFGELVPKNIALARPLRTAAAVVAPLVVFTRAAGPLIRALNGAANRLLRVVGVTPVEELRSARTPGEVA